MADDETHPLTAHTDRERLLLLDRDVRLIKANMTEGTHIMTEMQHTQHRQAIILERINNKSSLAMWVLGVIAVAVIGSIVAFLSQTRRAQEMPPIEVQVVYPNQQ